MAKVTGKSGIVKLGLAINISSATHSGGTITVNTTSSHGLTDETRILIEGVVGMTILNDHHTVAGITDSDTFTISLTTAQTYTSGGSVQEIIEVTNWSLTETHMMMDTTDSDSGSWRETTSKGIAEFNGTIEGFMYSGTRKPTRGTSLTTDLQTNGTDDFSGSVLITSDVTELEITGENAVAVSFTFEGTGALA